MTGREFSREPGLVGWPAPIFLDGRSHEDFKRFDPFVRAFLGFVPSVQASSRVSSFRAGSRPHEAGRSSTFDHGIRDRDSDVLGLDTGPDHGLHASPDLATIRRDAGNPDKGQPQLRRRR